MSRREVVSTMYEATEPTYSQKELIASKKAPSDYEQFLEKRILDLETNHRTLLVLIKALERKVAQLKNEQKKQR